MPTTQYMIGDYTRDEWLALLGIVSANDPKLSVISSLSWGGNALKVLRVNATENGWELAAVTSGVTSVAGKTGAVTLEAADVSDFAEAVRDRVGATLVAGSNVTITPNDGGDVITIAAAGSGGVITSTYASLPSAAGSTALYLVTDEIGGATLVFSDGTVWRRVQDRAVASAAGSFTPTFSSANVSQSPAGTFTRTSGDGFNTEYMVSAEEFTGDVAFEFKTDPAMRLGAGFSISAVPNNIDGQLIGAFASYGTTLSFDRGTTAAITFTTASVIRVERIGTTVNIKIDGMTVKSLTYSGSLWFAFFPDDPGSKITGVSRKV
jgi:hypothetical protein